MTGRNFTLVTATGIAEEVIEEAADVVEADASKVEAQTKRPVFKRGAYQIYCPQYWNQLHTKKKSKTVNLG